MKEKLVSIIVPVYQIEEYIATCIESLLKQTHRNIEIILVDDGSKDKSSQICEEFSEKDARVTVIHKENGGVSDARNVGMNAAIGEYIYFVDGDDYVHENFVLHLLESCIKNHSDISVCGVRIIKGENQYSDRRKSEIVLEQPAAIRAYLIGKPSIDVLVTNKMYKRTLFLDNNIIFPIKRLHEDNFTTYKLVCCASRVSLVEGCLYNYQVKRPGSITAEFDQRKLEILGLEKEMEEFFNNKGLRLQEELDAYSLNIVHYAFNQIIRNDFLESKQYSNLIFQIRSRAYRYLKNKYISFKLKVIVISIVINPRIYITTVKKRIKTNEKNKAVV